MFSIFLSKSNAGANLVLLYRNHVWRYDPQFGFVPPRTAFFRTLFTGIQYGAALFVVVAGAELGYKALFGSKDDHHHGDHGHSSHH